MKYEEIDKLPPLGNRVCYALRCNERIHEWLFMCTRHWISLPLDQRHSLWMKHQRDYVRDPSQPQSRQYILEAAIAIRDVAAIEYGDEDLEIIGLSNRIEKIKGSLPLQKA